MIAGSVTRVELLPEPVSSILWSLRCCCHPAPGWRSPSQPAPGTAERPARPIPVSLLIVLAAAVGCVGIYGIGGGSILAPILIGSVRRPSEVAPAALASTFITSAAS